MVEQEKLNKSTKKIGMVDAFKITNMPKKQQDSLSRDNILPNSVFFNPSKKSSIFVKKFVDSTISSRRTKTDSILSGNNELKNENQDLERND